MPEDEWPLELIPEHLEMGDIKELMNQHLAASGGNNRALTMQILTRVAGVDSPRDLEEKDFEAVYGALAKDIARYKHGRKKPK